MAAKRKYRKGLGTAILYILRNEGAASTGYLAHRLGYSYATIDNVLLSLDARKLITYGSAMYPGKKALNVPPPQYTITIANMSDADLNRYISQICTRSKPR